MRPLSHPAPGDITVEGILHALSDPVRARIFAEIAASECPRPCSNFLVVADRKLPKSTLSQHFKVLRESGLIRSERKGVELQNTTRRAELDDRLCRLVTTILEAYLKPNAKPKARKR